MGDAFPAVINRKTVSSRELDKSGKATANRLTRFTVGTSLADRITRAALIKRGIEHDERTLHYRRLGIAFDRSK